MTVTGVPGQAVTLTPVAATAAGPAVHALDTFPRTAPGLTTSARAVRFLAEEAGIRQVQ